MKKVIAFSLALVVLLTLCATAFAAVPTVSLYTADRYKTTYTGGRVTWRYILRSNSYYRISSFYRARFDTYIVSPYDLETIIAYKRVVFSGNWLYSLSWTVPNYRAYRGLWYNLFGTFYRPYGVNRWYVAKAYKYYLRVY